MRRLVLHHEGAPLLDSASANPIRARILEYPPDDVDLFQVWSVPSDDDSYTPAADITVQFARTWAMELATGDTLEAHIEAAPAFVQHHARGDLVKLWLRRTAERDETFLPAVLTSARVAA